MHRKLADKCARLERELDKQRQLTNLNLEAQKRWANSNDAKKKDHKPIKEKSNGSFRCWNCWKLGHSTSTCPEARRNWNERERLRQQKQIPADEKYQSRLESAKSKGWFTGEVQILQKASSSEPQGSAAESDDECTFMYPGLDYSINGLTATVNNNEVYTKPAKETFIQRVSRELKQQGVHPARVRQNARRGDPDTLFPEPDERGYLPRVCDPTEWLKSFKPPLNLICLLKCSPTYRKRILEYPFPDPTIETEEGAPPARQPSRRQVHSRTPPEEESELEENSRSPVRRLRNRDIWHGTPEELFKSLFDEAVPQGIDEARPIIDAAISYGPSIRMAAFVGKLYLHDLLVDCGTEVTVITLSLTQKILEANPDMSIKYDRSLNIRGGTSPGERGPHFCNETVLQWSKDNGIKWVFGAPGVAKSQGKAERSIKSCKSTIRKVVDEKKDWVKVVAQAQFAYNTRVPYGNFGLTPSVLLVGYNLRSPIVNLIAPGNVTDNEKKHDQLHHLREIRIDGIRQQAIDRALNYWQQRTEAYEKAIAKHTYQVGDLVLVQNYQIADSFGHPWDFRWKGPFRICYITRKGKVDLVDATGLRLKGWHTDKLCPYYLRSESDRGTLEISADIAKDAIKGIIEGKEFF
ncbi:hypothetical protein BDD12DRAFT_905537 [Trichophaea hybrida]|nr:hypothetical protein BDD12DRAFT_905537 [Trichophaea hybrida]